MGAEKYIGPEAAAYAAELRAAVNGFTARGGTQKAIAVSVHVAPATLSRYLSGERIAPLPFVMALDSFLAQRGQPLEAGVLARLQDLCRRAHEASGSPAVRLSHLQEELAQVRAEKGAGEAKLVAVQEHADQLAAELRQAQEQVRRSDQRRLALEERGKDQDRNLQHAQSYTRQLETDLTAIQEQVALIQREVKVLRRQNELLITEEGTASPGSRQQVKATVSGTSTQVRGAKGKLPRSAREAFRDSKKVKPWWLRPGPRRQPPPGTHAAPAEEMPVFVVSWTGNEDPRKFTTNPREIVGILLALGSALVFYYAGTKGPMKDTPVLAYTIGLICMLGLLFIADDLIPPNNTRKLMTARTLRLDDTGLTISDPSGKQHLSWASIRKISVHHTPEGINERRPLALHLQLKSESPEAKRILRPAGWPGSVALPAACMRPPNVSPYQWVPICVLGPLTGPVRTELQNTLTTYLGTPAEGI